MGTCAELNRYSTDGRYMLKWIAEHDGVCPFDVICCSNCLFKEHGMRCVGAMEGRGDNAKKLLAKIEKLDAIEAIEEL